MNVSTPDRIKANGPHYFLKRSEGSVFSVYRVYISSARTSTGLAKGSMAREQLGHVIARGARWV